MHRSIELFRPYLTEQDRSELPWFYPIDSPALYLKNLKEQAKDWPWRDRSIEYSLNSQGYRSPEFDQIDWSNSIVCFGCSMTFGIGLALDQTWPAQLEQLLGYPCVNLGIPGGSIQAIWANSVRLIRAGVRPRAVLYYWPELSRSCEFMDDRRTLINWGTWKQQVPRTDQRGARGTAWLMDPVYAGVMSRLMIDSIEWGGVPRLDWTWTQELSDRAHYWLDVRDRARDLRHPGPATNSSLARELARALGNLDN